MKTIMIWDFRESSIYQGTIQEAFRAAYILWGIKKNAVLSKCRKEEFVNVRTIMMKYLRDKGLTFELIGETFKRDHGTAMYAMQLHTDRIDQAFYNENYNAFLETIKSIQTGDPYSSVSQRWDGRMDPNVSRTNHIDRKQITNPGGFSDYE